MPAAIDFYFDFASPYGYLASREIDALAAAYGHRVSWRPILLGAVFAVTGSKPNMHLPLRGDYLKHDVQRIARRQGAPLVWPAVTPVNGLAAARAVWWLNGEDPATARRLAAALFHAHWGEGRDIGPPEVVAGVASGIGVDGTALLAAIAEPRLKDRLRAETDGAIARGVFGAPFFIVDGEPFWGWDRLPMLTEWLVRGGW